MIAIHCCEGCRRTDGACNDQRCRCHMTPEQPEKKCCGACDAKGKRGTATHVTCMHPYCKCHQGCCAKCDDSGLAYGRVPTPCEHCPCHQNKQNSSWEEEKTALEKMIRVLAFEPSKNVEIEHQEYFEATLEKLTDLTHTIERAAVEGERERILTALPAPKGKIPEMSPLSNVYGREEWQGRNDGHDALLIEIRALINPIN